jgi:hypothetical protein
MSRIALIVAISALLASPAHAQVASSSPPAALEGEAQTLSLEHRMLLRCSAAFALMANRQATGDAAALVYPPLQQRGQEFFVRASARVIDEAGLTRDSIAAALTGEALALQEGEALEQVMPACLSALESAGL